MADGFLKRRKVSENGKGVGPFKGMSQDREAYPALIEFLTCCEWPDGAARKPGTLLIFCDEGRLKICLADRDQEVVLFLSVDGLFVALEACDDALRAEDGDWRPSKKDTARRYDKK